MRDLYDERIDALKIYDPMYRVIIRQLLERYDEVTERTLEQRRLLAELQAENEILKKARASNRAEINC